MKPIYALLGAALIVGAAPAIAATTFQFDTDPAKTFVSVTSNPTACFPNCPLSASLATPFQTFSLNVGESRTFDFANFTVGSGFGLGSATVEASLGFVLPSAGPAGTDGSANYFRLGGNILGGTLTWDTPSQSLTAADGSRFTVGFGNLSGLRFGSTAVAPVTITLTSGAVPEPAIWGMLLLGFGGVGYVMRRKPTVARIRFA